MGVDQPIAMRDAQTLKFREGKLMEDVHYHINLQYIFFNQWSDLKKYANKKGLESLGIANFMFPRQ